MNKLKVFQNDHFGQVRTTLIDGEPWFVAADVCEVFGDTNYRRSTQLLDEDEKGVSQMDTPGGPQEMIIINESGLYHLLFNMQPAMARGVDEEYIKERKEKLRQFKRWVTHEVLPAIRRTGSYLPAKGSTEYLCATDTLIRLAQEVKDARLELSQQQARYNAIARDAYRTPEDLEDLYNADNIGMLLPLKTTAKLLGVPIRTFTNLLTDNGILYRNRNYTLMPKGDYNRKHFVVREYYDLDGTGYGMETLTTPEGREAIRQLVDRELE